MRQFLVIAACMIAFSACSTTRVAVGTEEVVEESAKKPYWVESSAVVFSPESHDQVPDDVTQYRGEVAHVVDLQLGLRQAEAESKKKIAESIRQVVETAFTQYAQGTNKSANEMAAFVSDGIAWVSEHTLITGASPVQSWYRKIKKHTADGVEYYYDCYSLVQISDADYRFARDAALDGLAEEAEAARNKEAQEAALRLLGRLRPTP